MGIFKTKIVVAESVTAKPLASQLEDASHGRAVDQAIALDAAADYRNRAVAAEERAAVAAKEAEALAKAAAVLAEANVTL